MNKNKILIIEDNPQFVAFLERLLQPDYQLFCAKALNPGLASLKNNPDIVILDLTLPAEEGGIVEYIGITGIEKIKDFNPLFEVIVLTGTTDKIQDAVKCIRLGAYDFLLKGDESIKERLKNSIKNALERKNLRSHNLEMLSKEQRFVELQKIRYQHKGHQRHPEIKYHFDTFVGRTQEMKEVYAIIDKITRRTSDSTVLITGESGTGKELAAAAIHFNTPKRRNKPFIVTNMVSLSPALLESELFGIEEKVATGVKKRIGYFEQANGSTLFLDEIAEIPLDVQAKLLRVLQEKKIQRIGSSKEIPIDVRIIAATNKNLQKEAEKGNFREDLYFRLNTLLIYLPPLREQRDCIPELANHFLYKFKSENVGNENVYITPEGKEFLKILDWPGNVRLLKSVVERAVVWREEDKMDRNLLQFVYDLENRQFTKDKKPFISGKSNNRFVLPTWESVKTRYERLVQIKDADLQEKVFTREFIEHSGHIKMIREKLKLHKNTANRLVKLALKSFFIELCQNDANIELLAYRWEVDKNKLEKAFARANRMKYYVDNLLKSYKDTAFLSRVLDVSEDSLIKVIAQYKM